MDQIREQLLKERAQVLTFIIDTFQEEETNSLLDIMKKANDETETLFEHFTRKRREETRNAIRLRMGYLMGLREEILMELSTLQERRKLEAWKLAHKL